MKRLHFRGLLIAAILTGAGSCTSVDEPSDPENPEPSDEMTTVNIRVVSNSLTRGNETDAGIATVYFAFYKKTKDAGMTLLYVKDSTGSAAEYSFEVASSVKPDYVVAFANVSEEDALAAADNPQRTISSFTWGSKEGVVAMSSAHYFVKEDNKSEVSFYSPIIYGTAENTEHTGSATIRLDRVPAKVTVSNESDDVAQDLRAVDKDGNPLNLSLTIQGWGLHAVDQSSYLLKQFDDSWLTPESANILSGFNNADAYTISWAKSVEYGKAVGEISPFSLLKFNDISNDFDASEYTHESTRTAAQLSGNDATPSIVIAGRYAKPGGEAETFVRVRDNGKDVVYFKDEYEHYVAAEQTCIYKKSDDGTLHKVDASKLEKHLVLSESLPDYVTGLTNYCCVVQLKEDEAQPASEGTTGYYNAYGAEYENLAAINKALYDQFGFAEKYLNGNCLFIVKVEHKYNSDGGLENALVRNHHYNLTIKSIDGFGQGVGSVSDDITDALPKGVESASYTVNADLSVNPWVEITQDIQIPVSK